MSDLITEHATYDSFAREWHGEDLDEHGVTLGTARDRSLLNEQNTRQLWQLLGLLDDEELVVKLPEWLAAEKVGFTERSTPTTFVGRVARETDQAIRFEESSAVRPLMRLAHRIHSLERGIEATRDDEDRRERLDDRLREKSREFERRDDATGLADEWLPKSQIRTAVRRTD